MIRIGNFIIGLLEVLCFLFVVGSFGAWEQDMISLSEAMTQTLQFVAVGVIVAVLWYFTKKLVGSNND